MRGLNNKVKNKFIRNTGLDISTHVLYEGIEYTVAVIMCIDKRIKLVLSDLHTNRLITLDDAEDIESCEIIKTLDNE